ncbi:MAG: hypothetical protein HQL52_01020 [Magnetococcales bacterium]|nr:hypothetical protein [Magnetococcales bacterium]
MKKMVKFFSTRPLVGELLFCILVGLGLFAGVMLTWAFPLVTAACLAGLLIAQWRVGRQPGDDRVMLIAPLLGTPAEMVEVYLGEWTYHASVLVWGVPLWLPLVWANLFVLFRRLMRLMLALLDYFNVWGLGRSILFGSLGGVLLIFCMVALFLMEKGPLIIGLYSVVIVFLGSHQLRERDVLIFFVAGILGAVGEYSAIQEGYWHYRNPYFSSLGVDITLPLDWGLSAIIINRLADMGQKLDRDREMWQT